MLRNTADNGIQYYGDFLAVPLPIVSVIVTRTHFSESICVRRHSAARLLIR